MDRLSTRTDEPGLSDASARPFAFLVSTTRRPDDIRDHLGTPAYSYFFVVQALAPVLERFGRWSLVDHPESRLHYAAAKAEAEGYRPVHLAIVPPQDCYLSPVLPNLIFPFWEFPDLPDRDFGFDTRQNWVRICGRSSLVLTACRFTAEAVLRSGVTRPVAVVPIPVAPSSFAIPAWEPSRVWSFEGRHATLSPEPGRLRGTPVDGLDAPKTMLRRVVRTVRDGYRQVSPYLQPKTVARVARYRRFASRLVRKPLRSVVPLAVKHAYKGGVERWLSAEALSAIGGASASVRARLGREPAAEPPPLLPSTRVEVGGGLVYLSILNTSDQRKNHSDLLKAFLLAFRDRGDVTLVLKLTTNRHREHEEVEALKREYRALGLAHRCRVVVITEFLDPAALAELLRVTTFYVNASHAEGACLPLMEALAGGRPAVAPDHTAMADYMDGSVGFVIRSDPEPTFWPHDPERRIETFRHRLLWSSLRDALLDSAEVAEHDPARYAALSDAARLRMAGYAGRDAAAEALRGALALLPADAPGPTP